jgi:hypothetical protein
MKLQTARRDHRRRNLFPSLAAAVAAAFWAAMAVCQTFENYEDVAASPLPAKVLWHVIARDGKSKNYTDLIPLDGGTVGIAHFATGGLNALYDTMDTDKYFGKSKGTMRQHYSSACRPPGKKGNDTGWGCYSQKWWEEGMAAFLKSDESRGVQHRAWAQLMQPAIRNVLAHKWQSEREIAIALAIANSLGASGLDQLATKQHWDAENTLDAYAQRSDHTQRRKEALDETFPLQAHSSE